MDWAKLEEQRRFSPEKMVKTGLFETGRFFCDLYCFEPGQIQKPHSHSDSDGKRNPFRMAGKNWSWQSFQETVSTGKLGLGPNVDGLLFVTASHWSCVHSYFAIRNSGTVTVCTGCSSGSPALLPISNMPLGM